MAPVNTTRPQLGGSRFERLAISSTIEIRMNQQTVIRATIGNQVIGLQLAVLIVAICGCAASRLRSELPQEKVPNRERVVDRNEWLDLHDAPLQYRHIGREAMSGPYRILISDRGDYCVVSAAAYTVALDGELWTCDWRVPRPY